MGPAPSSNPIAGAIYTVGYTINDLATAITQSGINLRASVANGALNLQATNTATTITVGNGTPAGNTLTDKMAEQITSPNTGIYSSPSTVTMTLGSGTLSGDDVLTKGSSIAISANGSGPFTFVVGGTTLGSTIGVTSGDKLSDLLTAIDTKLNVNGLFSGNSLTLTSNVANNTPIVVSGISLNDAGVGATTSVSSLGSFSSLNDAVSGKITFNLQGTPNASQTITIGGGSTVQSMIDQINGVTGSNPLGNDPYGVHAKATLTNDGFESITLTSDTYGVAGEIQNTGGTSIIDQTATAALSYTPFNPYSTGVSNYSLYDSSSGQTSAAQAAFVANSTGASGVATISYSDGAGQSLSGTDLLSQHDAQDALNKLNLAISDVAAMDGYIGAQINTLNSVSQVLSTQQENVVSAQNAIQATDYASATSNMSKYEILSQTGISYFDIFEVAEA
jgi:flagellin